MSEAAVRTPSRRERVLAQAPVVVQARDVRKTFQVPDRRIDTLKERVVHPTRRVTYRELHALRGISFDVRQGEFFGIVGRNGSGKSTLLKILASIYQADAGRIRVAGRMAPFIELGIGFNPELTARENVALNGVMMGLTRREAARRLDAVLEFAELHEFVELKLKNYSSGMMVRLAFATMVQADPDIMLIDEVLAVGDARFAQKCMDVFQDRRRAGRTLLLVTHNMPTVQSLCDQALLLHDGEQRFLGDPEQAAAEYYRLNFGSENTPTAGPQPGIDVSISVLDVWLEDDDGRRVDNVEQGRPIRLQLIVEARYDLDSPAFNFQCVNVDGHWIFTFDATEVPARIPAGGRLRITGTVQNPLMPGRFLLSCWTSSVAAGGQPTIQTLELVRFYVYGTRTGAGNVVLDTEVQAVIES
ncbi:MAG TPA: ABC transporter ATP-binding protein [Solirubrobacteraceae bacterium]|nr:ABC transporter ATP-binding protein [Solirubrobacteraceae bacterium]